MNYTQTTAPIPIDQIKQYFNDKTTFFLVNYQHSKIQGKVLLVYLANLDIPSDLSISEDVTKEQKFELLEAYFDIKSVSNVPYLNTAAAQIVLHATGVSYEHLIRNAPLTETECEEFITTHEQLVAKWVHFVDSTMIFLLRGFTDLDERVHVKENFTNIDDGMYVGLNVVNLFQIPGFLELYFSTNRPLNLSYFVQQFETHMFKGKSLFDCYFNEYNMFVPMLRKLASGEMSIDALDVLGV